LRSIVATSARRAIRLARGWRSAGWGRSGRSESRRHRRGTSLENGPLAGKSRSMGQHEPGLRG
jgi:hypothetical protein